MGLPLRDCPMGATGPTGLCALRAHHTRLIKTGDYQARSFTALEAAM